MNYFQMHEYMLKIGTIRKNLGNKLKPNVG